MLKRGLWAEVSSGLEMRMALKIGVNPQEIVFNSPYKSDEDLETALRLGCKLNVDNMEEIHRIVSKASILGLRSVKVGVRISPTSGTYWDKFGFQLGREAYTAIEGMVNNLGIDIVGIHMHRSNIVRLNDYEKHLREFLQFTLQMTREGIAGLEYVDIGSGFAVDYPAPNDVGTWNAPSMKSYSKVAAELWNEFLSASNACLIIEPGRRLVAPCVVLLTKVVSVKDRPEGKIVIVDIGQNLMPGVDLYRYPISQLSRSTSRKSKESYSIHGCLCDSLDVIAGDLSLDTLEIGDVLCVHNVGGYDMSRSFAWQIPRAPVIWIGADGNIEQVRRREDVDDLWRLCA